MSLVSGLKRLALAALVLTLGGASAPSPRVLAITHVAVIDATGTPARKDMTLIVRDGRIAAIAPTRVLRPPAGAEVVDGAGKFLIPGLWDMHAHAVEVAPVYLPVMVANGVTGIRNMHAVSMAAVQQVRARVADGAYRGPTIIASGPLVDGPTSPWPTARKVTTAAEGRQAVADLQAQGADFIKVYSFLPREAYFAIAAESKARGLPFAGHVTQAITVREASDAGQASIEHLDGILRACSREETTLNAAFLAAGALWRVPATASEGEARMVAVNDQTMATYDAQVAGELFAVFRRNRTWQTPTLVTMYINAHRGEPVVRDAPDLRYVYASQRKAWANLPAPSAAWTGSALAMLRSQQRLVGAMRAAGVRFLAGTDVGGALIVPGVSLHQELALLVDSGLTPMEALQAATRNPAEFLGRLAETGTVERGKAADLVLLDANPLLDIHNTRRIAGVILRGTYLSRSDLDAILASSEAEGARH